jgi:phospholipid/cholesterol/gamma-HCH transport system ATP-binding protein
MVKRSPIHSLEFKNMTFAYDDGPTLFDKISFAIPSGRVIWIRSAGGRGKSTLLKIFAGLLSPSSGAYIINGKDVSGMSFEQFLEFRLSMGYGFDMGGLLNNKSLYENLILPLLYHKFLTPDEADRRIGEVLAYFNLTHLKNSRPSSVSGSQRKLTCMIRPFVHWPQIVLLDDPATGLTQESLNTLIRFIEEGFTNRGLRQLIFTGESEHLAKVLKADELTISGAGVVSRTAA